MKQKKYPANFEVHGEDGFGGGNGVLKEGCICCGADIPVTWTDEMTLEFALVIDVCPMCYRNNCSGMSLAAEDNERWCNVLNRKSRPTMPAPESGKQWRDKVKLD